MGLIRNHNNKAKIIACHGNVTRRSTAKMLGITLHLVHIVLHNAGLSPKTVKRIKRNPYKN